MLSTTGAPGTTGSVLLRNARLVPVGRRPAPSSPVDVLVEGGQVTQVGPDLRVAGDIRLIDADGRWLAPGLWDHHVHMRQWALMQTRLDLRDTSSQEEVLRLVADAVAAGSAPVIGFGHRTAIWASQPTVADLDAVSGGRPVVLISGDGHHGWLSSAALHLLGLPPREGVIEEGEWFDVYGRLSTIPGAEDDVLHGYRLASEQAARKGVVGIVDMEFDSAYRQWPMLLDAGIDSLRVRAATYTDELEAVVAQGFRTGDPLVGGQDLVTMGPLKIITDGSLNTRTAHCCDPYADSDSLEHPLGFSNVEPDELQRLVQLAHDNGLQAALHAIGDAAVSTVLDAFEATGAAGSVEHAQLMRRTDVARMARLGVRASVQPAHLLDDRDVTEQCWPDRADRCYLLRSMTDAGVAVHLGSDAPVATLDPWLAMAAAVHRSADEREPWHGEEALTAAEAFAASTDGQGTVAVGSPGDVVLLEANPVAAHADSRASGAALRQIDVSATVVAGRVTWEAT